MCVDCDSVETGSGLDGNDGQYGGASASRWKFETSVAVSPTSQYLRMNNTTYSSVTAIYINETNDDGTNRAGLLASFSVGGIFGRIRLFKEFDSNTFWYGTITAVTDAGSYYNLTVTYTDSNGTFAANDKVIVEFTPTGATGATGAAGTAGKGMFLSFTQDPEVPYVASSADAAYVDIATILWPGSTNVGTFTVIQAVAWTSNAANAANFKIIDETNTTTIAEQVGVTSTSDANIISFTTVPLANLTTTAAVWRVQAYNTGGANEARLGAISAY